MYTDVISTATRQPPTAQVQQNSIAVVSPPPRKEVTQTYHIQLGTPSLTATLPMQAPPSQHTAPDVPEAVTTLLDAMRRLEDTLRLWGAQQTTEEVASDVFVIVGNYFCEMLTAFASYGIDTEDILGFLPDLRRVLEECLNEDPTPENVDYLVTQARTIIASLLTGLSSKQPDYWRAVNARRRLDGRREQSLADTGISRKARTKDLDQIQLIDLDPKHRVALESQPIDIEKPGLAQHYCVECAKYYETDAALNFHWRSKVHKRRCKALKEPAYTIEESERAAGLGRENKRLQTTAMSIN
ncbi:hypothetical protein EW145_g6385 [Phellinidium pouzarii]|uniref:C2H2-type domain-containing protein n=1 Tax=Phellinidium pouzarii TaxID=167371 RepID=A0A4S4KWZ6_9AGAM|nr:hypothetical protein EW145_g6385 [Phellinidium pouzarii]